MPIDLTFNLLKNFVKLIIGFKQNSKKLNFYDFQKKNIN